METYVSFVNRNWKQALTKFRKMEHTEENAVDEEATENSKYCGTTPEGLLHSMWLHSLTKGEVVIEERFPQKKPLSPYLIFCKEKEKKFSHLTWKEFGVMTRKEWKELGDEEREKFKDKSKELKKEEREKFQAKRKTDDIKVEKVLKKPRSAFSIYIESLSLDVSKIEATSMWSGLNEEDQKEFMEKEREELESYKLELGERGKGVTGNRRKRRMRVKKPRSPFAIFMDEVVKEVTSPEGKDDEDVMKEANNQWRKLDKKEKEVFNAKALKESTQVHQETDVKKVVAEEKDDPVVGTKGGSSHLMISIS